MVHEGLELDFLYVLEKLIIRAVGIQAGSFFTRIYESEGVPHFIFHEVYVTATIRCNGCHLFRYGAE